MGAILKWTTRAIAIIEMAVAYAVCKYFLTSMFPSKAGHQEPVTEIENHVWWFLFASTPLFVGSFFLGRDLLAVTFPDFFDAPNLRHTKIFMYVVVAQTCFVVGMCGMISSTTPMLLSLMILYYRLLVVFVATRYFN